MFIKFYESLKQFIIRNYITLLFYLVFIVTFTYPLPFYIFVGGGCIDTSDRVIVESANEVQGSFHLAYVSQVHATIPTFVLAKILPSWKIESIGGYQITDEETTEELMIRDRLYLEEANTAAIFNAYQKASQNIQINHKNLHVIYIEDRTKTNLKIGDIIQSVDGKTIQELEEIKQIVEEHSVGDTLSIQVLRNGKTISCQAEVFEVEQTHFIGVSTVTIYDYDLDPTLTLKFKNSESGPSGGLILTLTIYNQLVEEDITKGRKIVGTGTIDMDGKVSSIGGVSYKLQGAVQNHADIFLVPNGENYEECISLQKKKGWEIQIIGVDSFEDALMKLK